MQNITILGGTGLIGKAVSERLCERYNIRSFSRRLPKVRNPKIEYMSGDFRSYSDVSRALDKTDIVIHLISSTVPIMKANSVDKELATNVADTTRLLGLVKLKGIKKICFASSGGAVYEASNFPATEIDSCSPTSPYGIGKLLIEDIIKYYSYNYDIDCQIWRISNPYGDLNKRNTRQGVVEGFLRKVKAGKPIELWGNGTAVRDFIHISDLAAAIEELIYRGPWNNIYNIGSGEPTSIGELIKEIERMMGGCGLKVHHKNTDSGTNISLISIKKMLLTTSWLPCVSIEEGLRRTWKDSLDIVSPTNDIPPPWKTQ